MSVIDDSRATLQHVAAFTISTFLLYRPQPQVINLTKFVERIVITGPNFSFLVQQEKKDTLVKKNVKTQWPQICQECSIKNFSTKNIRFYLFFSKRNSELFVKHSLHCRNELAIFRRNITALGWQHVGLIMEPLLKWKVQYDYLLSKLVLVTTIFKSKIIIVNSISASQNFLSVSHT